MYISESNFEKAKKLLKKAYKLKRKCLITSTIKTKLKHGENPLRLILATKRFDHIKDPLRSKTYCNYLKVIKIIKLNKQITLMEQNHGHNLAKLSKLYEELSDSYCTLGNYNFGLNGYKKQVYFFFFIFIKKTLLSIEKALRKKQLTRFDRTT